MENKEKKHPIIAGILDFYFICIGVLLIFSLLSIVLEKSIVTFPIILGLLISSFICSIFYHSIICKKISFLSLGEILSGKVVKDNNKNWENNIGLNRFFIFFIFILNIAIISNSFDGLSSGKIIPLSKIIGIIIIIGIFIISYTKVIKGNLYWLLLPCVPFLFAILIIINSYLQTRSQIALFAIQYYLFFIFIHLITFIGCFIVKKKKNKNFQDI